MTPSLLTSAALKIKPFAGRISLLALGCFLGAIALLALAVSVLESFHTLLFFVAWPLFVVALGSIGLLILVPVYTPALQDTAEGNFAAASNWLCRIERAFSALFITLWFIGLCLILMAGLVMGLLHFFAWLGLM